MRASWKCRPTSAARSSRKVGTTQQVIVDEVQGSTAVARSRADAPEIDGLVKVKGAKGAKVGEFLRVRITAAGEHDLAATVIR